VIKPYESDICKKEHLS
jgi:UDP-N-acetylglucosamine/UDP-N-acetylgalactosamine diphosphorylase